jgi:DNA-binding transcriptional regulator LsrR (DeoR family)
VDPIHCALQGQWLKGMVTDESTAAGVLEMAKSRGAIHGE